MGSSNSYQPLSTIDGGVLSVPNGALLDFGKNFAGHGQVNGDFQNNGDVFGGTGGETLEFLGLLTGVGDFSNDVTMTGGYSPGLSPAEIDLETVTFSASNLLTIELGGLLPGIEHDVLNASVTANLGGTLLVQLLNGHNPQLGNAYDIFNFAVTNGSFDDLFLPGLDPGLLWDISTLVDDGVLRVAAIPEPSSVALAALMLVSPSIVGWRRRRRK